MARSPIRSFFDGLVGGLVVGALLTILIVILYVQQAIGAVLLSADWMLFLIIVLIGVVVGVAYDAHKATAP
jgi:predicted lipid-binding transport protein (Tim44 family)